MGQSFSINHLGTMKIMDQHGVLAVIEKVGLFNTYDELENYNLRNGIINKPTISKNTIESKKPEIKKIEEAQKVIDATDWNLVAAIIYACKEADQWEKKQKETSKKEEE